MTSSAAAAAVWFDDGVSRAYEAIVERYVQRIVDGELLPGKSLRREQDLAGELGVSRGVVREVIRALQEPGLVRVTHGRGQRVTEAREWKVLDPVVLASLLTRVAGRSLLEELYECRIVCEVPAAGLAAERASDEDRAELTRRFAALPAGPLRARNWGERVAARAAERGFHDAIVSMAGNRPLAEVARPVLAALERAGDRVPRRAAVWRERRRILEAIVARDAPGARTAMDAHLHAEARGLRRGG
jgi:DNA-binding FadR family transcriptional regulator